MAKCHNCFYFREYWEDDYCCGYCPAACEHPDCFIDIEYQDRYGNIEKRKTRNKDIIDLNKDDNCNRFEPYHYEKRKLWWIFYTQEKVKG
jgi:hypothetical protein